MDLQTPKPADRLSHALHIDKFSESDIYFSLRMPSAVAPKVKEYQSSAKEALEKDDQEVLPS